MQVLRHFGPHPSFQLQICGFPLWGFEVSPTGHPVCTLTDVPQEPLYTLAQNHNDNPASCIHDPDYHKLHNHMFPFDGLQAEAFA